MANSLLARSSEEGNSGDNPLGGVRSDYRGPRAQISRDTNLSWWRRILPIIASHRGPFAASIILSFASLIFQTWVPSLLNGAITSALEKHRGSLHRPVIEIAVVAIFAGVSGILSRHFLYRTAYEVEADLRSLIYEHLTWLSFSFFDRVQSGQLISRANSDIRSVQMYATFAPLIVVQTGIGILAFGFMLTIDPTLTLISLVIMPILYVVGIKMRRVLFPISWITQSRLADVAPLLTRTSTAYASSSPSPRRRPKSIVSPTPRNESPGPTSRTRAFVASGHRGCRTCPNSD